jgi:hypothetical protein
MHLAQGGDARCVSEDPGSHTMDFSPILLTFQQKRKFYSYNLGREVSSTMDSGQTGLKKV